MNNNKITLGISFLLYGVLALLDSYAVISVSSEKILGFVLIFYSVPTFYSSLNNSKRASLITATALFFVGIMFLVKSYFQIIDGRGIVFASILFVGGAVMLVLYLENLKEKIFMISGVVLILLSIFAVTILKNFGLFDLSNRIADKLELFWPVILIVLGISLFINRKK